MLVLLVQRLSSNEYLIFSFETYVRHNILDQLEILNTEASYRMSTFETRTADLV